MDTSVEHDGRPDDLDEIAAVCARWSAPGTSQDRHTPEEIPPALLDWLAQPENVAGFAAMLPETTSDVDGKVLEAVAIIANTAHWRRVDADLLQETLFYILYHHGGLRVFVDPEINAMLRSYMGH